MPRKVVVVLGSPRREGNSAILARHIARGAQAGGAQVQTFFLHEMDIRPCSACEGCHQPDSTGCVIDDDMQHIYPEVGQADALVIATPIYWFTMSAQTKTFVDRCYALGSPEGHAFAGKRVACAMTYGAPDPVNSGCVNAVRTFQDAFRFIGADLVGMVWASAWKAGEIRQNDKALHEAFDLGKKLVGD